MLENVRENVTRWPYLLDLHKKKSLIILIDTVIALRVVARQKTLHS